MCKLLGLKLQTEKRRMLPESQGKLNKRAFELSLDPKDATEVGDETLFLF